MLSALLAERERQGKPIRVGIIGAGKFGGGLVAQIAQMQGMVVAAIADIDLARARYAYAAGYGDVAVGTADSPQALAEAIHAGKFTAVEDGLLVAQAEGLDVVVEATGSTSVGANMASATIASGNHLVMVNVETDVTIGALLKRKADSAGVVYSLVDGDQPGVTMNIIEWAWSLGLEVVAAGRGTVLFADDPQGTPDNTAARFGFDAETLQRPQHQLEDVQLLPRWYQSPSRGHGHRQHGRTRARHKGYARAVVQFGGHPTKIQLGRRRGAAEPARGHRTSQQRRRRWQDPARRPAGHGRLCRHPQRARLYHRRPRHLPPASRWRRQKLPPLSPLSLGGG